MAADLFQKPQSGRANSDDADGQARVARAVTAVGHGNVLTGLKPTRSTILQVLQGLGCEELDRVECKDGVTCVALLGFVYSASSRAEICLLSLPVVLKVVHVHDWSPMEAFQRRYWSARLVIEATLSSCEA